MRIDIYAAWSCGWSCGREGEDRFNFHYFNISCRRNIYLTKKKDLLMAFVNSEKAFDRVRDKKMGIEILRCG